MLDVSHIANQEMPTTTEKGLKQSEEKMDITPSIDALLAHFNSVNPALAKEELIAMEELKRNKTFEALQALKQIEEVLKLPPSIDTLLTLVQIVDPDIRKEELIAMGESEREKMLRRLRKKGHPDRNFSMEERATTVFQDLTDHFEKSVEQIPSSQGDYTMQEQSTSNNDPPPSDSSSFDQYCESAKSNSSQNREAAYQFLSKIVISDYKTLTQRDIDNLVHCTSFGIQHHKEVAAIKLWITICEEEQSMIEENSADYRQCVMYTFKELVGSLLTFAMINDVSRNNESSISKAAATCLKMISQIVKDLIIDEIVPFVEKHIKDRDWRKQEAAIMAFCCILDGPSTEKIGPHVAQIFPLLLEVLKNHPQDMVKDTSSLTIATILELHIKAIPCDSFPTLVGELITMLLTGNPSSISANAAQAIHNLALAFLDNDQAGNNTNDLSHYMGKFFEKLSIAVVRRDADEKLRTNAFEAMLALVRVAPLDCSPVLERLLYQFLDRLQVSLSRDDPENEIQQCHMCSLIHEILVSRIIDAGHNADFTIEKMIELLENGNSPECFQEAFTILSKMCKFLHMSGGYVARICEQVKLKLNDNSKHSILAVELVSNIAKFSKGPVALECAKIIMPFLLESLQNKKVHYTVEKFVYFSIGDIAQAVTHGFKPYLELSMKMLTEASLRAMIQKDDDFTRILCEGVLDGYYGVVNGMKKADTDLLCLRTYKSAIVKFLKYLSAKSNINENVCRKGWDLTLELSEL